MSSMEKVGTTYIPRSVAITILASIAVGGILLTVLFYDAVR